MGAVAGWASAPGAPGRARAQVPAYLSVGQKRVHSLQKPRIQHVGLIHYKRYLFVFTAGASQHGPEVFVEVLPRVLPVHLRKRGRVRPLLVQEATRVNQKGDPTTSLTLIW